MWFESWCESEKRCGIAGLDGEWWEQSLEGYCEYAFLPIPRVR
jgi:hypothetical protein